MTTRLFLASTLYGTATLAAALDAELFTPADRRVLIVANNAATPETTPAVDTMAGFERLRDRFDEVVSWNEAIAPFHPGGWSPRGNDLPLWERYLRMLWRLGDDDLELTVESIQVNPALALAQIFLGAPVDVYADGLMSYGPTRSKIDPLVGTRVRRLLHLDLVPGLTPMLLTEFGVSGELVPSEVFLKVLAELAEAADGEEATVGTDWTGGTSRTGGTSGASGSSLSDGHAPRATGAGDEAPVLLLGQYLSALAILTQEEEEELHLRMVRGAVALGHRHLVFKPHPTAPAHWSKALEEEAERLGARLTVRDEPVLAEVLYQRARPALVVGCFSTALLTASAFYGLPVARVGTRLLLERLAPYENSNRVPVTIVDVLVPELTDRAAVEEQRRGGAAEHLGALVRAVGFAMQPKIYPGLRAEAERFLSPQPDAATLRYFKRRRLTSLALPGGLPPQLAFIPRNATIRKVARRARSLRRAAAAR
ncbi:alpha-2,8-polysialyltransferase family protein [Streptomyces tsukubensis]|uniref:alpha-2,8-polysialyltransferase family protein n=1 Tax=Streptomyces tsukubensis TaxID=83656 RepID=UPI001D03E17E|nr:alpha-2,8-polysialyltransferase family protein [Streptomyces tsukubensis]